jgi:hypothetical protein
MFLTLALLLYQFVKDQTTPKTHIGSWVTLSIAMLIWPVALSSLIRKKLSAGIAV